MLAGEISTVIFGTTHKVSKVTTIAIQEDRTYSEGWSPALGCQ